MAVAPAAGLVVVLFMALPFFVESAPRAYRLKAGNADPSFFNIPRDIPGRSADHVLLALYSIRRRAPD